MKNKLFLLLLILTTTILIISCNKNQVNNRAIINEPDKEDNLAEEIMKDIEVDIIQEKLLLMSLDDKIGQLFIIGLEGKEIDQHTKEMIKNYKVGGFILFGRNVENQSQLLDLTESLKALNQDNIVDLFISIDEEGGTVSRLPSQYSRLPEAKKLGDLNNPELSYEYGQLLGLRLNTLGINLDFAPVLDINSNPKNPVIGNRSFGNSAEIVINNGTQVLKGIGSKNIISCVKHFPGHGDTSIDSHLNLPIVNKTLNELEELELLPFKVAIEEGVEMIMVAHILFPELDKIYPSTMSKQTINHLLREKLGFKGVVISDDMTMGAIIENYSLETAVLEFLNAGGDIALIGHGNNPEKVIKFVKECVDNGSITIDEIDEKVYRILALKQAYNLISLVENNISLDELNSISDELIQKLNN